MLDPLYCHTCNKGNLDGPTIAACRRPPEYCDARKTAAKLDYTKKQEMWKREREAEQQRHPIPVDTFDTWSMWCEALNRLFEHMENQ